MFRYYPLAAQRAATLGACAALALSWGVAAARAEQATAAPSIGRVEFDHRTAAQKFVEFDLSQAMFGDLFGIGDAALAGVVEGLASSPQARDGSHAVQVAADKAAALRELVSIVKNVVGSVRIRAYDGVEHLAEEKSGIAAHYDQQLTAAGWEKALIAQDGNKSVQISLVRSDGAIRGIFILAADDNKLALVNAICDISPENAQRLATAATKAGLQGGLEKQLEKALRDQP